jgi:hypothetical protein
MLLRPSLRQAPPAVDEDHAKEITAEILAGDRTNLPGMVRASFGCYNNHGRCRSPRRGTRTHRPGGNPWVTTSASIATGSWWPRNFTWDFGEWFPHFSFRTSTMIEQVGEAS